jgi:hypothetical protein
MTRPLLLSAALLLVGTGLSGCLALTVADAATSAAVGTAKVGAKAVGAGVDVVTTSDRERCLKDARRERFDKKLCYERR